MSEIQQFYEGQNVFITGGTGFIGKILVEKLLRGFPNIGSIYLLTRSKKSKPIKERLNEIITLPIFEPLRKINPDFQKKIVPLNGDIMEPGLGLSIEDRALIIKEVSIVFHAAAVTKFNEPLSIAVPANVNSIMELISICRECKKLKVSVYVSTAFSQCIHKKVEEKVYPVTMNFDEINNTVQIMKRRNLSKEDEFQFTKILLGKFPNTYVFTKAVAEGVLNEKAKDLPLCIFRFPVAMSTYKEPMPGWVDTVQGFNQALIGASTGVLHVICADLNANVQLVPADFACNALIASAWESGTTKNRSADNNLPVYNYVSDTKNPLTWRAFDKFTRNCRPLYVPNSVIYYPEIIWTKSKKLFTFFDFFLHLIPALIGDLIFRILGKKPILHKIYKKGIKLLEDGEFFLSWQWTFECNRVQSMWNKLSKTDKELMPFDLTIVNWETVISEYWKGMLMYIIKDDMSPEGRQRAARRVNKLYKIHRTVQAVFATLVIWLIWKVFCVRIF